MARRPPQLAHAAGRKGSTQRPWHGMGILTDADTKARNETRWGTVSSTTDLMEKGWNLPHALTVDELAEVKEAWRAAAERSLEGWLRYCRSALRPWLPHAPVPFAADQQAHR